MYVTACIMCFAGNSNRIYHPKMAEHFKWHEGKLEKQLHKFSKEKFEWSDDPKHGKTFYLALMKI